MENGSNEISYIELDKKINDMKVVRLSLTREIDQNSLVAIDLREALKAMDNKKVDLENKIKELEVSILNRRAELSSIDNLLDKERKMMDAEKRDLDIKRETLYGEQTIFAKEKAGALEAIEDTRKKLSKEQVSSMNRDFDMKAQEKDIAGQILELGRRRVMIQESEVKASAIIKESEVARLEVDKLKTQAQRVLDDAKAEEVRYNAMVADVSEKEKDFIERESRIKTCYNEIDVRKKELDEQERDLVIEMNKLKILKQSFLKEVERSRIEGKEAIKKEIG